LPRQKLDGVALRLGSGLDRHVARRRIDFTRSAARISPERLDARLSLARGTLGQLSKSLPTSYERFIGTAGRALAHASSRFKPATIERSIAGNRERVGAITSQIDRAVHRRLERSSADMTRLQQLLQSLSYKNVLARGYALVRDDNGNPVRSGAKLAVGKALQIEFGDQSRRDVVVAGGGADRRKPKSASDEDQGSFL
ncbi:MAG: exodeoxyribonuclease VII large subunit, partial [Pseudomonadota bacterium]